MGCGGSVSRNTRKTIKPDIKLSDFIIGDELGSGRFAKVVTVVDRRDEQTYAMKIIDKKEMIRSQTEVKEEIRILQMVDKHPNIVHLIGSFEDEQNFYLVMELCVGGDVFSRIIEEGQYTEKHAIRLCKQLASALSHIHSKGITHRDLKPENILLAKTDSGDDIIKVCDFGLSKIMKGQSKLKTVCGTWAYCAPEVINHEDYSHEVDCWALGVLQYVFISGYHPFDVYGDTPEPQLFKKILDVEYDFDDPAWEDVSTDCKTLINKLLEYQPHKRLSMDQYLKSAWINSEGTETHQPQVVARLTAAVSRRSRIGGGTYRQSR